MKTALVTGASKGIGLAIAQKLIEMNIKVYGVARTEPDFKHDLFTFFQLDLLDKKAVTTLGEKIKDIDILINNAGVGYFRYLEHLRESEIEEMLHTNLLTPMLLTKTFLTSLKKNEGYIINIGSVSALEGYKFGTGYCASKFGLRGFTESLWQECRNDNVKVTLINPGYVRTPFFDDKDFAPEDNDLCAILPEDIADVVKDILTMRQGSVVREIKISSQKNSLVKRKR